MTLSTKSLFALLLMVVGVGTVFFRHVEGWSWIDAYFFTVVTLSTVGYGQLVPATVIGKIGTTFFIFFGLGIFALAIQQFGQFAMLRRRRKALEKHLEKTND
ncbi:potassium channel family protein [Lentibacter algarum]|uniref:potassium channel family protein n=1 Tax=Lentibacter algarum TaxID=576131 RepID=UPI001C07B1CF|nr:potassium channel family protein [Lentibacter algarum]MBU2982377.1 potassium channel family protein [Lentibacter algarum]